MELLTMVDLKIYIKQCIDFMPPTFLVQPSCSVKWQLLISTRDNQGKIKHYYSTIMSLNHRSTLQASSLRGGGWSGGELRLLYAYPTLLAAVWAVKFSLISANCKESSHFSAWEVIRWMKCLVSIKHAQKSYIKKKCTDQIKKHLFQSTIQQEFLFPVCYKFCPKNTDTSFCNLNYVAITESTVKYLPQLEHISVMKMPFLLNCLTVNWPREVPL